MRLKPEVNPSAMRPELLLAVVIACRIYDEYDYECIVTSLNDSAHSQTSLHYAGSAVDLRTRDIPAAHVDEIAHAIRASLTQDYDVLRETDHIHIEYQPRRRK